MGTGHLEELEDAVLSLPWKVQCVEMWPSTQAQPVFSFVMAHLMGGPFLPVGFTHRGAHSIPS